MSSKSRFSIAELQVLGLGVAVFSIVALMIFPVPTALLDLLIVLNLGGALTLLLASLFAGDTARLPSFPTILVLMTLFRLALNLSSTRLLLLDGDAGVVIRSFGQFVVGGNLIAGIIALFVLVLVQMRVVTKGADRASEVYARFTLGRQHFEFMRIESDVRSGAISSDAGKALRDRLEVSSALAASMSGLIKFVKGDAILGLVITVVNILGGLIAGMVRMDMSMGESLEHFALLTVGDGLVSQVPSLVASVTAVVVVTRLHRNGLAGSSNHLVTTMVRGVLAAPKKVSRSATAFAPSPTE